MFTERSLNVHCRVEAKSGSSSEEELVCGKFPKSKDAGKAARAKRTLVRKRYREVANLVRGHIPGRMLYSQTERPLRLVYVRGSMFRRLACIIIINLR